MKIKTNLIFKEMIKETTDIYSFIFEIPDDFTWICGQHGIFRFVDRKINDEKEFRVFSFASIKEEGVMVFSTRIVDNPSDFKTNLLKLKVGDIMTVDSAMGKFNLTEYEKPHCLIAGGIGITPIRSFLKQMDLLEINPNNMKVLYSDDRKEFAYSDTFKLINQKYEGLDILKISDRDILNHEIDLFAENNKNNGRYYISGAPGMVKFITQRLLDSGIEKHNIKTDLFVGY